MSIAEQVTPDWANSERLSGTTASDRSAELKEGHWYTVYVGAAPVCIITGASDVDSVVGRPILGAYTSHAFIMENGAYIAAISADGSTAFTLDIVPSSPGAGAA